MNLTTVSLAISGFVAGILAGFLGIGGGTVLVPVLVLFGSTPLQAVATSNLAIVCTSLAGSIQNYRMGNLALDKVMWLGLPSIVTAQLGVWIARQIPAYALLAAFGVLLLSNFYLFRLQKQLSKAGTDPLTHRFQPWQSRLLTGGTAGVMAGLFGIGGGAVMVPLQILLLGEGAKVAIQTSLGAIVITAVSALAGHALDGNVRWQEGLLLGISGLLGVQVSTRVLPKLSDPQVSLFFQTFLGILALYVFVQAWVKFLGS